MLFFACFFHLSFVLPFPCFPVLVLARAGSGSSEGVALAMPHASGCLCSCKARLAPEKENKPKRQWF